MKTRITEMLGIEHPIIQGACSTSASPSGLGPCRTRAGWASSSALRRGLHDA